ncbi:precorrin-3B C(17)-methyltransferase [Paracoccus aminophilus]|uniref:Precorrin-3B C17-methyltransferase n=1 Tax=Paracoccus aminophilus JCM 7686 TaxID=1367847 RepID=S5YSS5_PARAH|nr:precorrin-3B C(17)-methyltransferase [Paracoccus aminophilus]AGT08291.1 precorrin-3B C17-methyltransferase [Paracoccus aminophilus JCM 7686]
MSGHLTIAGLGPGAEGLIAPEASAALARATDVLGYIPYVRRIAPRPGLTLHETDNREELDRARHAISLAQAGKSVVVVSSGDPGVFAMAAAVFEALEEIAPEDHPEITVIPGITAMLAAAARAGAPLGHDFCAINLSDNLKPAETIRHRIRHAALGGFAIGFYNPRSKARPDGFARALEVLREICEPERIVIFARAVSTPDEAITVTTLAEAREEMADMRTVVLIGNAQTRRVGRWVYTPRSWEQA